MTELLCPDCHSARVRRVRRAGLRKVLWSFAGWWPWLCDACGARFDSRLRDQPHGKSAD